MKVAGDFLRLRKGGATHTLTRRSPREPGVFLIAAHATEKAPPEKVAQGEVAAFRDGEWTSLVDRRGTQYWRADATFADPPEVVRELGETVPEGALLEPPAPPPPDPIWEAPGKIAEESKKLDMAMRKKFYRGGLKSALREALGDGDIELARELIRDAAAEDGLDAEAKTRLLSLIPNPES